MARGSQASSAFVMLTCHPAFLCRLPLSQNWPVSPASEVPTARSAVIVRDFVFQAQPPANSHALQRAVPRQLQVHFDHVLVLGCSAANKCLNVTVTCLLDPAGRRRHIISCGYCTTRGCCFESSHKTSTAWRSRRGCRQKPSWPRTAILTVRVYVNTSKAGILPMPTAVSKCCSAYADTTVHAGAHCLDCSEEYSTEYVRAAVFADEICACSSCGGLVKPRIVFFG